MKRILIPCIVAAALLCLSACGEADRRRAPQKSPVTAKSKIKGPVRDAILFSCDNPKLNGRANLCFKPGDPRHMTIALYLAPNKQANPQRVVDPGDGLPAKVTNERQHFSALWYEVVVQGKTGWVAGHLIRFQSEAKAAPKQTVSIPKYAILTQEDMSYGLAKRMVVRISIQSLPSRDQIEALGNQLLEQNPLFKRQDALALFLYLPGTRFDRAHTGGAAEWAPDGDWGSASKSKPDRSSHRWKIRAKSPSSK